MRFFWALINPLLLAGVISFVFRQVFGAGEKEYILSVFSGYLLWHFSASALMAGHRLYLEDRGYFKKLASGKLYFMAGYIMSRFITALPGFIILVSVCAYCQSITPVRIISFILLLCLVLIFVFAVTQIMAVSTVFIKDLSHALDTSMLFLLWLSPVFYSIDAVPEQWRILTLLNPVSWMLDAWRFSLGLGYALNPVVSISAFLGAAAAVFYISVTFFNKHSKEMTKLL